MHKLLKPFAAKSTGERGSADTRLVVAALTTAIAIGIGVLFLVAIGVMNSGPEKTVTQKLADERVAEELRQVDTFIRSRYPDKLAEIRCIPVSSTTRVGCSISVSGWRVTRHRVEFELPPGMQLTSFIYSPRELRDGVPDLQFSPRFTFEQQLMFVRAMPFLPSAPAPK